MRSAGLKGSQDHAKEAAAQAALILVQDGMRVGLGTGDTVGHLLPLLRGHARNVTYVATSPRTEQIALELGLSSNPIVRGKRPDACKRPFGTSITVADRSGSATPLVRG
jgi:ribose 5-phosphate isomerase